MATAQRQESAAPENLSYALKPVVRRMRNALWLRFASRGLLAAVLISCLPAGLAALDLLPDRVSLAVLIPVLLVIGFGIGTIAAFRRRLSVMEAARIAESRLGLKERLSSALEFEGRAAFSGADDTRLLLRLQNQDAARHARALEPKQAITIPVPREAKWLVPAVLLLIVLIILANLHALIPAVTQIERAIVSKSGKQLVQTADQTAKQAAEAGADETQKAAVKMQDLGKKMADGHMSKQQAMAEMAKLSRQMDEQQRKGGAAADGGSNKSLADAGDQYDQAVKDISQSGQQDSGGAAKPAGTETGAKAKSAAPSNADGNSQALNSMKDTARAMRNGDAEGFSQRLRQMAQEAGSGSTPPQESRRTADGLHELAKSLQGTAYQDAANHIQAAADALKRGDRAAAGNEMNKASESARQSTRQENDRQGLQDAKQAMDKIRDDMAQASKPEDVGNKAAGGNSPQQSPKNDASPASRNGQSQAAGSRKPPNAGQPEKHGEGQHGGTQPSQTPGQHGGTQPGQAPGQHDGTQPGQTAGQHGGSQPGQALGQHGGTQPGQAAGQHGGSQPGQAASQHGGTQPGQAAGQHGGSQPGQTAGQHDGSQPGQTAGGQSGGSAGKSGGQQTANSGKPGAGQHGAGTASSGGREGGNGSSRGHSQGGGSPGNTGHGQGSANASGQGKYAYDTGPRLPPSAGGPYHAPPHILSPKFNPAKNPTNGQIYLGKPSSTTGTGGKVLPKSGWVRPTQPGRAGGGTVPYTNYAGQAKRAAESAVDKEEIPPAYKKNVKSYFESLQQQHHK